MSTLNIGGQVVIGPMTYYSGTLTAPSGTIAYVAYKKDNVVTIILSLSGTSFTSLQQIISSSPLPENLRPLISQNAVFSLETPLGASYFKVGVSTNGTVAFKNLATAASGGSTWTYQCSMTYLVN